MDQRTRNVGLQEAIVTAISGATKSLWTALPAVVQSYNPDAVTCTAQPAIAFKRRDNLGNLHPAIIPPIQEVPVVFPHGGGMLMSWPLVAGDEVLLVFCSRCIDGWWEQGGTPPAAQAELRYHDLSDAIAIPGPFSKKTLPSGIATTSIRLGKADGSAYVEVTPEGVINVVSPSGASVTISAEGEVDLTSVGGASIQVTPEQIVNINGPLGINLNGPTNISLGGGGVRPPSPQQFQSFFDTNLGLPIWWSGTEWVNSAGTPSE